jgi:metallo-beta-lactamase class B
MFGSALLAAAAQFLPIVIALQTSPPEVPRDIAPIETTGPQFAATCKDWDDYDKPASPVRVLANTYYVGTCGISSILITGTEGDILIDAGTENGADLIVQNIRNLGFWPSDVRILLHSHEHFDHVGGMGRLQQLTGAQLYASATAAKVFATGTATPDDPQAGINKPFPTARVSRALKDGEIVRLGNLWLTAVATPGHTPGAMSWHWVSCNGGICRSIVYADSLSPVSRDDYRFSDHPDYLKSYRHSIARIAALDCDIVLTPHPSASAMVARFGAKSLENRDGCRDYAAKLTKQLDERLAKEANPK